MTDARRITVGPIAAAYLEIQQATDFDALHAEAEAMRVVLLEIASANPSERGIEWAKSYASDGLKGAGSELYARWLDTFKEAEALRAENWHWKGMHASSMALRMSAEFDRDELRTELDEARGLLREAREAYAEAIHWEDQHPVMKKIDAFLDATQSPEVRCTTCDGTGDVHRSDGEWLGECHCVKTEQGERQEPVAWALANSADEIGGFAPIYYTKEGAISWANGRNIFPLYTTPQPGPEVRRLVEAMNFACKSLCHVTSSDGSGHADIALSVLRMAGVDGEERERLVDGWKASCQWRIDKAHRQAQSQA